jgi:hypothetical protein
MKTNFKYFQLPSFKKVQKLYGQDVVFTGQCRLNKLTSKEDARVYYNYAMEDTASINIWSTSIPIKD